MNFIGNEGRKNITKKYDVEAMCDSTLREYKKLLKYNNATNTIIRRKKIPFTKSISGFDLTKKISKSLEKSALIMEVDGSLKI